MLSMWDRKFRLSNLEAVAVVPRFIHSLRFSASSPLKYSIEVRLSALPYLLLAANARSAGSDFAKLKGTQAEREQGADDVRTPFPHPVIKERARLTWSMFTSFWQAWKPPRRLDYRV